MKGLILAGGRSTRLYPLTLSIPKPMVPILNRPFLEHMIDWLRDHDVRDIVLTTSYLPQAIRDHFKSGARHGVRIEYVVEEQPLGTGGAIKNAQPLLDETFFVFNGDILTGLDLRDMLRAHRHAGARASISLAWVDDTSAYGVIETDASGRILRFLEKPKPHETASHYINAGTYIFEPEVLEQMPAGVGFSIEKEFYPQAITRGVNLHGYRDDSYWLDIGTADKYIQAHCDLLAGKINRRGPGRQAKPGVWAADGVSIAPDAEVVPPVMAGARCVIGARAVIGPEVVLGDDVRIEEGAIIARSVVWNSAVIAAGARLDRCIVGCGAKVPAGARMSSEAITNQEQLTRRPGGVGGVGAGSQPSHVSRL